MYWKLFADLFSGKDPKEALIGQAGGAFGGGGGGGGGFSFGDILGSIGGGGDSGGGMNLGGGGGFFDNFDFGGDISAHQGYNPSAVNLPDFEGADIGGASSYTPGNLYIPGGTSGGVPVSQGLLSSGLDLSKLSQLSGLLGDGGQQQAQSAQIRPSMVPAVTSPGAYKPFNLWDYSR